MDNDGDIDTLFHFKTQDAGIVCGMTEATLTDRTLGSEAISGTDSVHTVGCK